MEIFSWKTAVLLFQNDLFQIRPFQVTGIRIRILPLNPSHYQAERIRFDNLLTEYITFKYLLKVVFKSTIDAQN